MSTSTPAMPKKRFDIGDFLLSIIPLFIMIVLSTAATMPAIVIGFMKNSDGDNFNLTDTSSLLASDEAQMALTIGYVIYAIVAIIIFYFWYKKVFLKKQTVISNKEIFTVKNVITTIVSALGVSAIISFALMGVNALAPEIIENYNKLMEGAGLGSNILTTVIYACILGPIAEEFIFRGVTQAYLTRSNAHPVVVIAFQALLFGIAHMNLVQSTYAVLLGLFLGFLRYKGGNIRIAIFAHIVFNVFGTFGTALLGSMPDAVGYIFYGVFAVASIVTLIILGKTPTAKIGAVASSSTVNA